MSHRTDAVDQSIRRVEASLLGNLPEGTPLPSAYTARKCLKLDRWILASALQKCIRRGLVSDAIDAALALHALDPEYAWRRLRVISLEDVGLGDIRIVSSVLAVAGKRALRTTLGDVHLYAHMVWLLADAIKDRTACDLITWISSDPRAEDFRSDLLRYASTVWEEVAVNDEAPIWKRLVALQLLDGHSARVGFGYRTLSKSNPSAVMRVVNALEPEPEVSFALLRGKGTESLNVAVLFAHVLWKKANRRPLVSHQTSALSAVRIGGVIAPSFCMYTRIGLHAMRRFLSCDPRFKGLLMQVGATNALKLLGLLLFQVESGVLDRAIAYAPEVRADAEYAELAQFGVVGEATHAALRMELLERIPALNKARRMAWRAHLNDAGLFEGSV